MRMAMGVCVAVVGAAAMGDEVISTFGNPWLVTAQAASVGQVFVVPESNELESVAFGCTSWEGPGSSYAVMLYRWDEAGQTVDGLPLWGQFGALPYPDVVAQSHEVGVLLERGEAYALVVQIIGPAGSGGVAVIDDDVYDGGPLVATTGGHDLAWDVYEGWDMLFSLSFGSCRADMNGDGMLNIFDFLAFQGAFTAGKARADCNGDGVLNVLDFVCFQAVFQAGCGGA